MKEGYYNKSFNRGRSVMLIQLWEKNNKIMKTKSKKEIGEILNHSFENSE